MKKLDGLVVAEEWDEYAVVPVPGVLVECASFQEAMRVGGDIVARRVFITEWTGIEDDIPLEGDSTVP